MGCLKLTYHGEEDQFLEASPLRISYAFGEAREEKRHDFFGVEQGGHWSDQYASSSYMSAGGFINSALNSQYGGAWSDGQAYYFKSDEEAFAAGVAYNFEHNSWGHTYYGSYEATLVGYMAQKVSGELLSPEAVHTAIDIVRSKHMYDGRPDFLASTGPGTPDPTYSYAGIVYQPPIVWTDSSFWLCSISRISCSADKQK